MKKWIALGAIAFMVSCSSSKTQDANNKWISLFDGKSLTGWKVGDNSETFKVENGAIVANGNVAHLFYDGQVMNHDFKNFEFKASVMTFPGSNSGLYFHTNFQQGGWPAKGYD